MAIITKYTCDLCQKELDSQLDVKAQFMYTMLDFKGKKGKNEEISKQGMYCLTCRDVIINAIRNLGNELTKDENKDS